MKLPEISQVQFQASAQSKAFDPLKLPDPNPQLAQNLSIIQQSFKNLSDSYQPDPTFLQQFAELVPKAVGTAIELQKTDVAIQMARSKDQYFQMLNSGDIPTNGEPLAIEQIEKNTKGVVHTVAAEAAEKTNNYDVVRGILGFSNHGEVDLRKRLAGHMFTNVYPDWMNTQLEVNESTVMVENESGELEEVQINKKNLPDYQHKQIMSHLRTAFLGHEHLADTNPDLIQKEMAAGFKTDATISQTYSRNTRANDGTVRFNAGYTNMFKEFTEGNLVSLGEFQVEAASMYDKKGINLINTPAEFYKRLLTDISTAAENGAEFPIGDFIMKAQFEENGPTFMERAPRQARLLMRTYRDKRRTYLSNKLKADTQDLKFAIAEYGAPNAEDPKSVSDYVAFKTTVRQRAAELGIDANDMLKVIDQQIRVGSMGADELNILRENAEIALATGNASQTADYYTHPVVGLEFREKVDKAVERIETPEYKINSKEISTTIGGATKGTMVDPLGNLKGQAVQVNAHYQRIFDDKYAELTDKNTQLDPKNRLTPKAIADQSRDASLSQWQTDSKDEGHKYYVNPKNGNFDNFPVPAVDQAEVTQNSNVRAITSEARTQKGVLSQIAAQPQLSLSREAASDAITNFNTTGIIDPTLVTLQNKINETVGKRVIQNPMQIAIAAAQGYGDLKPNETVQAPAFLQRAGTTSQKRQMMADLVGLKGNLYTQPAKYGPVAQMKTRPGMPNVAPVFQGETPKGLTGLSANDYRELGFIVSAEAGPGDDKYAVAASIINRLATGGFGDSIPDIGRADGQYEAVYKGKAFYSDDLTQDLASPEGQRKIAQMLMLLDGRTDFKGQSQIGNRDPDNDPMVDPLGNFFHYAGQTGLGPYTGTVNRNYRRFLK